MNTTAAAAQAGVTIPTIHTWCRRGVVTAVKQAGRWIIDAASLAHRITIGQLKTRKAPRMTIDLAAEYTVTYPGDRTPTVITPKICTRDRDGAQMTTIRGIAPLLAAAIDAIADEGDRLHTLTVLSGAVITISSQPRAITTGLVATRDAGRLATSYEGTRHLPVDAVLDLAEQVRSALGI